MKLVFLHGAGSSSLTYYYQLRHFRNSKAIDPSRTFHRQGLSRYRQLSGMGAGFHHSPPLQRHCPLRARNGRGHHPPLCPTVSRGIEGNRPHGNGRRLHVHLDYLDRCREPGPDNTKWLAGYMKSFKHVAPDMHPVLSQRAVELGPEVQLNDLLACDQFDVMDQLGDDRSPGSGALRERRCHDPGKIRRLPNGTHAKRPGNRYPGRYSFLPDGGIQDG